MGDTSRLPTALSRGLGVRRSVRLSRVVKHTGLPPEALLDLAIELVERLADRLPRHASDNAARVGLASGRWNRTPAEKRSAILRAVARARWTRKSDDEPGQ